MKGLNVEHFGVFVLSVFVFDIVKFDSETLLPLIFPAFDGLLVDDCLLGLLVDFMGGELEEELESLCKKKNKYLQGFGLRGIKRMFVFNLQIYQ